MAATAELAAAPRTNRYDIVAYVGSGASGLVYKAIDRTKNLTVALKSLKFREPEEIYYLKGEFRSLRDIYHPNLIQLYDLSVDPENHCFFTMEFVEGQDFLSFLCGPHPGNSDPQIHSVNFESLRIALGQIVDGLDALHRTGVAHRDIKPSNIVVEPDGRAVILDFGLSLGLEANDAVVTGSRQHAGTPAYMAPERLLGTSPTPESDWFSVGVMLYQALTSQHPFASFNEHSPVLFYESQKAYKDSPPSPKELNSDTPQDIDELVQRLLRWDPDQRATGVECKKCSRNIAKSGQVTPLTVRLQGSGQIFVGRKSELETLQQAYLEARQGKQLVVRMHGQPGVGKTAIVERFIDTVHELEQNAKIDEALVLRSRCHEQEDVQFKALDGLVDNLSHFLKLHPNIFAALQPHDALALTTVFPVLARIPFERSDASESLSDDPHVNLRRAFQALRTIITEISRRQPVIVWVDDFQRSDDSSIPFLRDLMLGRRLYETQLADTLQIVPAPLIIVTYRSGEGKAVIAALMGEQTQTVKSVDMEILPLGSVESRDLFDQYVGDRMPEDSEPVSRLADDAEGLPLFVMELAHYYRKFSSAIGGAGAPPKKFDEVLGARVASLPDSHRHILELTAVARRPLPEELLISLAGTEAAQMGAIYTLCRENLLRRTLSGGRAAIESYHDNIRHSILPVLESAQHLQLHREIAEGLESHAAHSTDVGAANQQAIDEDYELLVEHYAGAENDDKVAHFSLLAGRAAANRLSFDRATGHLALTLKLRDRSADDWQIREEYATALANAGRAADAGAEFLEVGQSMKSTQTMLSETPDGLLRASKQKVLAAEQFLYGGLLSYGLELLQEVFGELRLPFPANIRTARLISLRNRLRVLPIVMGIFPFKAKVNTESIPEEIRLRLDTLWVAAKGTVMLDYAVGDVMTSRYVKEALQLGEPSRAIRAMGLEASVYANIGGNWMMKRSESLMDRAVELAAGSDDPYDSAMLHTCRTTIAWCSGKWRQCALPAKRAIKSLHECAGTNFDLAIVHGFALSARVFLGEIREVRIELDELLEDAERRGDRYFMNVFQSGYLVFLHLANDDAETAVRRAESTLQGAPDDRFTSLHFHKFNSYTNALLYSGQAWEAWMYVVKTWPDLRRAGFPALACIGLQLREIRARCAIAAASVKQRDSSLTDQSTEYTIGKLLSIAEEEARQIEKRTLPHAPALAAVVRAGVAAVRNEPENRKSALVTAANGFELDDVQMELHADAARFFLTQVDGDSQAHAQVRESMIDRGILRPEVMAGLLVPGQA